MGLDFGHLAKIRRIAEFTLSHHEQRMLPGIGDKVQNTLRRIYENVFRIGVPFSITYMWYEWGEATYKQNTRKNPADYAQET